MSEQLNTIVVNGEKYDLSMFSDKVKNLVKIANKWNADLQDQRLELAKTEAAIRQAHQEIAASVNEELKSKGIAQPEASAQPENQTPI